MKIKVSIPEEMRLHNETFMLARVVEVEIDDEQMKVLAQEVAARLRLHLTGGICTCFKNNLGTINVPSKNCPVHKSHSG